MAISWLRRPLACVFLVAVLCTGCNLMSLPFFLMPGMDPKIDAKFKLAKKDKDDPVKIVILASNGLEARQEFLRADYEISRLLARKLEEAFKNNKENVTLVQTSHVQKYKDEHPNWQSPAEIGKYFEADYVINLTINAMSLYETGSMNTLFRGRADISVEVVDVHKSGEGPVWSEEYIGEYPKSRGPLPASDSSIAQFRQRFLTVVSKELSWYFTAHLVEEDHNLD